MATLKDIHDLHISEMHDAQQRQNEKIMAASQAYSGAILKAGTDYADEVHDSRGRYEDAMNARWSALWGASEGAQEPTPAPPPPAALQPLASEPASPADAHALAANAVADAIAAGPPGREGQIWDSTAQAWVDPPLYKSNP